MNLAEIPLFAMLRDRLGHLSERQRVIAQNVANAETAGYVAQDVKPFAVQAQLHGARGAPTLMAATQAGHMHPKSERRLSTVAVKAVAAPGSETTLNGNAVVLEEEMMKMSEARMNYDAAIGFYQKSMNILRTAARAPSR
ncbi:flagellar basal body rod protein FlgB [Phenylobacterium sp. J426]|uniref:flagellar biosynthesis protein FlgB n=1 Tax=Phenylobacterium sp. J426 TaxID=2898439 RepID=UPI002151CB7F|nr:flagellar biosynthesis protein FlgB [Phenylobacterium sp. J426]MCR5874914.1 flagellar basal body rod protein FlgB [Phenylobacterium sp. J426]